MADDSPRPEVRWRGVGVHLPAFEANFSGVLNPVGILVAEQSPADRSVDGDEIEEVGLMISTDYYVDCGSG